MGQNLSAQQLKFTWTYIILIKLVQHLYRKRVQVQYPVVHKPLFSIMQENSQTMRTVLMDILC